MQRWVPVDCGLQPSTLNPQPSTLTPNADGEEVQFAQFFVAFDGGGGHFRAVRLGEAENGSGRHRWFCV
jgi:hypothetical protein